MSSNSVLKDKMAEKDKDVVVYSIDDSAGSSDFVTSTSNLEISEDIVDNFIDIFTEDILPEIFDNLEILTAKDLLHFRLVNRCWRDAATTVLLQRSMCKITLDIGEVALDEDGNAFPEAELWKLGNKKNDFQNILPGYKYFNFRKPLSSLSDLNQLICTSPKFPSNSICFHPRCTSGIESLCPTNNFHDDNDEEQNQKDLFQFFSLYGKKIRKLTLVNGISKEAVQSLLCVHLPHVVTLDLQQFEVFYYEDETPEASQIKVFPRASNSALAPSLELKEIVVGYNFEDMGERNMSKLSFLEELINVSPNLIAIQNVDSWELELLFTLGKLHLIKSLHFDPTSEQMTSTSIIEQLTKHLTDAILDDKLPSLKLSKLTIELSNLSNTGYNYHILVAAINRIMITSKNTLRYLELHKNSSKIRINLFIPPFPHLKCLRLVDDVDRFADRTQYHFLGDAMGRAILAGAGEHTSDGPSGGFTSKNPGNSNIPTDYFPRLRKVNLSFDIRERRENNSHKLMDFFSLDQLGVDGATTMLGDTLLKVTTLEWIWFPLYYRNVPQLFPNVVHLKIQVMGSGASILQNWNWAAFPKLERFELSGLSVAENWDTNAMDSFFTGFSPAVCSKIEKNIISTDLESCPGVLFERTQPYIGDCENLKEFQINFTGNLKSKFVSKVTALYALQAIVPLTKIIFSCCSFWPSLDEVQEMHHHLDQVAAYVDVRMPESMRSFHYSFY